MKRNSVILHACGTKTHTTLIDWDASNILDDYSPCGSQSLVALVGVGVDDDADADADNDDDDGGDVVVVDDDNDEGADHDFLKFFEHHHFHHDAWKEGKFPRRGNDVLHGNVGRRRTHRPCLLEIDPVDENSGTRDSHGVGETNLLCHDLTTFLEWGYLHWRESLVWHDRDDETHRDAFSATSETEGKPCSMERSPNGPTGLETWNSREHPGTNYLVGKWKTMV